MENTQSAPQAAREAAASIIYDDAMLESFVQKPEKFAWYKKTFGKYNNNGIESFAWSWSWWAFFFSFWYLLYRKSYLAALGYFIAAIVFSFIPFIGGLVFMIISGGTAPYFVYKTYKKMVTQAEAAQTGPEERISTMKMIGGFNTWVIAVAVVLNIIIILFLLMYMMAFVAAAGQQ